MNSSQGAPKPPRIVRRARSTLLIVALALFTYDVAFFTFIRLVAKDQPGDTSLVLSQLAIPPGATVVCSGEINEACAKEASKRIKYQVGWLPPSDEFQPQWLAVRGYTATQLLQSSTQSIIVRSSNQQFFLPGKQRYDGIQPNADTVTGNTVVAIHELSGRGTNWEVGITWCWGSDRYGCFDYGLSVIAYPSSGGSPPPIPDDQTMLELFRQVRYG